MKRPAAAIYAIAIAVSISPLAMAQKSGSHTGSCTSSTSTTSSASTAASASGAASRGALSTASSNVSVPYSATTSVVGQGLRLLGVPQATTPTFTPLQLGA